MKTLVFLKETGLFSIEGVENFQIAVILTVFQFTY